MKKFLLGVAVGLVLAGMGLFAVFTACFASWFIEAEEEQERISIAKLHEQIAGLRADVQVLRDELRDRPVDRGTAAGE